MKRTLLILLSFFSTAFASAQTVSIDYVLGAPKVLTEALNPDKADFFQSFLSFEFGGSRLADQAAIDKIKGKTIFKVQLVYSSYKGSDTFSQESLNRKRIAELQRVLPELFANTAIEWELVEQLEDADRSKARALFHGFVFYSREMAYEKDGKIVPFGTKEELAWMKAKSDEAARLLKMRDAGRSYKLVKRKPVRTKAKYLPRSKRKRELGIRYNKRSIWRRKREKVEKAVPVYDTVYSDAKGGYRGFPDDFYYSDYPSGARFDPLTTHSHGRDTVVLQALSAASWKNTVVVEDVTGSMFPYMTQTIVWRKFHIETTSLDDFAFFNDGDSRPDGPIGKSNGVGFVSSRRTENVEAKVMDVMAKGNGGAGPENNVEATLRAIGHFDRLERVLLIADNFAPVRDMEIFEELKEKRISVNVVVCGSGYAGINADYLEIARDTGGVVYTMEQTIEGLSELKEGETVTIGKTKFTLRSGRFVPTR